MKYKEFFICSADDNMPDDLGTSDSNGGSGDGDKKQHLTEEMLLLQLHKYSKGISSINTILKG